MLALRERATHQAFVSWSLAEPREGPLLVAGEVAAAIQKDGARKELYPLEVAALAVCALRAADVPAMLVGGAGADRASACRLDPSGRFGYFGVAVGDAKGAPQCFDAYGGSAEPTACADCTLSSDLEAIGAALSLHATQRLAQQRRPGASRCTTPMRRSSCCRARRRCAARARRCCSRTARRTGAERVRSGGADARRTARARTTWRCCSSRSATASTPRARSRRCSSSNPTSRSRTSRSRRSSSRPASANQARAELDKAEALDPHLVLFALTRAQYFAMGNPTIRPIAEAKRAIARGRTIRRRTCCSRASIARRRATTRCAPRRKRCSELVPAGAARRTHQLIEHLLGPTAFEPSGAEPRRTTRRPLTSAVGSGAPRPEPGAADPGIATRAACSIRTADPSAGTLKPSGGAPRLRLRIRDRGRLQLEAAVARLVAARWLEAR